MSEISVHLLDLFSRYLHIVCTTVLVGGTLFYEMVVPEAIDELKQEQQLNVFGRARWVFKRLVWTSALLLILTGIISTRKHWSAYTAAEDATGAVSRGGLRSALSSAGPDSDMPALARRPGWWWAAHASTGMLAVLIAMFLTTTRQPPNHPIGWMRMNLVILLVVIFLASATRHVRSTNEAAVRGEVRIPFVAGDGGD